MAEATSVNSRTTILPWIKKDHQWWFCYDEILTSWTKTNRLDGNESFRNFWRKSNKLNGSRIHPHAPKKLDNFKNFGNIKYCGRYQFNCVHGDRVTTFFSYTYSICYFFIILIFTTFCISGYKQSVQRNRAILISFWLWAGKRGPLICNQHAIFWCGILAIWTIRYFNPCKHGRRMVQWWWFATVCYV